ncbi:MAG: phage protein [Massilibacillus sp.]|nr:phage protein [Massilibacillus sp.]
MPTLSEIEKLIPQLSPRRYTELLKMKEIPELVTFLHPDETILRITPTLLTDGVRKGIFIATNTRCFFLYKGGFFNEIFFELILYDKISSVEFNMSIGQLVIYTVSKKIEFQGIIKEELRDLCVSKKIEFQGIIKEELRDLCDFISSQARKKSEPAAAPASANTGSDMIAQLERLAHLKEQGAITEEEFIVAKKKLLGM